VLEAVGLTQLEVRAYRALVTLRESTFEELRRRLGLTAEEADGVFSSLTAKGLVTTTTGEPRRLVAAPPDVAGEVLLLRRMQELQAARMEFARLAGEYRTALTSGTVDELIEVVPREAVPQLNEQLNSQATTEVMWVNAQPVLAPVSTYVQELDRLAQGIKYRCIYARPLLDEPGVLDIVRRDIRAGEQARVIDKVPLKMGIVDRRVGLLPLLTGMSGTATSWLLVHRCSLLDALIALFETMWLSALPLDGVVESPAEPPTERATPGEDTKVLTLLLAGMTDEAVARQLGIGKRTVLRRVRQLMDRGGVSTRIQLGWQASQLGWVTAALDGREQEDRVSRPNHPGSPRTSTNSGDPEESA
jgi:predicted transcriptional regulator